MTAEELFALPRLRAGRRELLNGEMLVLPPGGVRRGRVGATIAARLGGYVREHDLGTCLSSRASFILRRDPDTVRSATLAFIASDREFYEGPPDLAVEIFDWNNDYPADIAARANDWIEGGTPMVLIVEPARQTVRVVTRSATQRLTMTDTLTGGDVVPGWSLPLRELFE